MIHHHDGVVPGRLPDHSQNGEFLLIIHPDRRLIEEENRGIAEKAASEGEEFSLTARKPPAGRKFGIERIAFHARLQNSPDPGLFAKSADIRIRCVRLGHLHVSPKCVVEKGGKLRHHRDVVVQVVRGLILDRAPAENHLAFLRIVKAEG